MPCSGSRRTPICKRSASIGPPQRGHRVPPKRRAAAEIGSESAFRWNAAERLYLIAPAHNPEVAGSNPAPLLEGPGDGAFFYTGVNSADASLLELAALRRLVVSSYVELWGPSG